MAGGLFNLYLLPLVTLVVLKCKRTDGQTGGRRRSHLTFVTNAASNKSGTCIILSTRDGQPDSGSGLMGSHNSGSLCLNAWYRGELSFWTRSPAVAERPRERAVSWNLVKYCTNVRRTALEKACKRGMTLGNDLQGHSRSLTLVPFDRPHTISY